MRRFLRDKENLIMDFPDEHNEFQNLVLGTQRGTVGQMLCTEQTFDRSNLVSGDPSTEDLTLSDKQSMPKPYQTSQRVLLSQPYQVSQPVQMTQPYQMT